MQITDFRDLSLARRFEYEERHERCIFVLLLAVLAAFSGAVPDAVTERYEGFFAAAKIWGSTIPPGYEPIGKILVGGMTIVAVSAPFVFGYWLLFHLLGLVRLEEGKR